MTHTPLSHRSVLVVGASRGLGLAIARTYVDRGARVVATVRGDVSEPLRAVRDAAPDRVEFEHVDIADGAQIAALANRLRGRTFDLLFVVAGISLAPRPQAAADIEDGDFVRTLATNALGAMRVVERLQPLVSPTGTIAVLSSGQGSITNNTSGGFEVYRASKAALNQLMRSFAARHANDSRALLLLAPGWIRTDMGGDGAGLEIDEAIPTLIDTVEAQRGTPGLRFLDRTGIPVPW
ncbi:SDR family NAD(P)-dependent oxidoreductase [Microbacterium sp. 5K110]|jgi:NAD(P)-dependent dehydrogenase (short-subunit alcohol dehydrogenase family)|uniref:SDR family NAD(P)-dependent oxidoreductase n=1 Tax=unclassified Microbacterium TaxID=2609290 RepID=UPI0010FCFBD7|nr:SDR family NAD(P)-dependent oxidoreductase [Microbacterium sp. 5K110]TLF34683.1 SDR family NAD(P)-dependent oxidoreductase [Microbacterium sp. 5K110]